MEVLGVSGAAGGERPTYIHDSSSRKKRRKQYYTHPETKNETHAPDPPRVQHALPPLVKTHPALRRPLWPRCHRRRRCCCGGGRRFGRVPWEEEGQGPLEFTEAVALRLSEGSDAGAAAAVGPPGKERKDDLLRIGLVGGRVWCVYCAILPCHGPPRPPPPTKNKTHYIPYLPCQRPRRGAPGSGGRSAGPRARRRPGGSCR